MSEAFDIRRPHKPVADGVYVLTDHARERMAERDLSADALEAALTYGRLVREDRRLAFVIGRKEVERYAKGTDDREPVGLSAFEGVQICVSADGYVKTVIRRCNFKAIRRPRRRPQRRDRRAVRYPSVASGGFSPRS